MQLQIQSEMNKIEQDILTVTCKNTFCILCTHIFFQIQGGVVH